MDLILFQPGDAGVLGAGAGSLIQGQWTTTPGVNPLSTSNKNPFFELVSINHGMKQQITTDVSNQARTSGRPIITEFTCVKYVDASSVKLYDYCLRAAPLGKGAGAPSIIYLLRNSGETLLNIMTIQIRDAIISEIQFQSHPDDMPTEQFTLNFTEVLWTYTMQANDVTSPGQIASGWSIRQNRAIGSFTSP